MRCGRYAFSIFMLIGIALFTGCSSNGGGAPYVETDRVPPVVSDFAITPPNGDWRAGSCAIELRATDNEGVTSVLASVSGPGAAGDVVSLTLVEGSADLYRGSGVAPPNTDGAGRTNTYWVTAWALDEAGNSTTVEESLSFTIPPPDAPLPPPSW